MITITYEEGADRTRVKAPGKLEFHTPLKAEEVFQLFLACGFDVELRIEEEDEPDWDECDGDDWDWDYRADDNF